MCTRLNDVCKRNRRTKPNERIHLSVILTLLHKMSVQTCFLCVYSHTVMMQVAETQQLILLAGIWVLYCAGSGHNNSNTQYLSPVFFAPFGARGFHRGFQSFRIRYCGLHLITGFPARLFSKEHFQVAFGLPILTYCCSFFFWSRIGMCRIIIIIFYV